ncbi:glycosyltransferase 87 family protein [Nocardioides sp. SOB77]|uniref:Glycosyltransferase 87 family protein n=1 Tax=Nocardioides oceani TaxID=3058369 RepID=A0ABT8FDE3_9ACTN|nr:glycosyltransferase 87 family protein [Nocardioides oceani]MDN4172619.1 glycosyltransferase 87 family protein [Nocardioides oceani]
MVRPDRRQAVVLGLAAVAAVVAAAVEATSAPAFVDLSVYRFGAGQVVRGEEVYAGTDPASGLPFTYPPFAALLFLPLAVLPSPLAAGLLAGASVAALGWTVRLLAPTTGPTALGLVLAGLVVLEPVEQTLSFGQVNLLLLGLVTAAVLQPDRARSPWLLGVAAGLKLTPLVFVVLLALVGRGGQAGRALAVFGGTVLLGAAVLPRDAEAYWTAAVWDPDRVGGVAFVSNQSVNGLLARLGDGHPSTASWLVVAGATSLAALASGVAWYRRGHRDLGLALAGAAMLLASPVSWSHHWVWVVVAVLALPRTAPVVVAVFATRLLWWPPHREDRELDWGPVEHLAGGSYLLLALILVLGSAAALVRAGRRPTSAPEPEDGPDPEHDDGGTEDRHRDDAAAHGTPP